MTKVEQLKSKIEDNREKIEDLKGEIDNLENEKEKMKKKLNSTEDYQQKGSLQQGINFIDDDIKPVKNEITEIEGQNHKLRKEIDKAKGRVNHIANRVLNNKKIGLRKAREHKKDIEHEYKNKLKSAKEQIKNSKRGYNSYIAEIENLVGNEGVPEGHGKVE